MDKEEFIKKVNEKHSKTRFDNILIPVMKEIMEYFSSISSMIDNTDESLKVGFDYKTADMVDVTLSTNIIRANRFDDKIVINFVSTKDNEYTQKYDTILLCELIIKNDKVVNKENYIEFSANSLDQFLKYLLA